MKYAVPIILVAVTVGLMVLGLFVTTQAGVPVGGAVEKRDRGAPRQRHPGRLRVFLHHPMEEVEGRIERPVGARRR